MRVKIDAGEVKGLKDAMRVISGLTPKQPSLPILANVLIEARDGKVVLIGTELETAVRFEIPAVVKTAGATTINARGFHQVLRGVKSDLVIENETNARGKVCQISADGSMCELQTMTADDYPCWRDVKADTSFIVPQATLKEMFGKVVYAIPPKDPRRVLLGANLIIQGDNIRLVTTDGKRLGLVNHVANVLGENPVGGIIPSLAIKTLCKCLGKESDVRVDIDKEQVCFSVGDAKINTRKIEGDFPNCELVIPATFDSVVRINKTTLKEAVKRVSTTADDYGKRVDCTFTADGIGLESSSYDFGSSKSKVAQARFMVANGGESFQLTFNYEYLLEMLAVMDTDWITLHTNAGKNEPVIFHEEGREESLFLLMPIKRGADE